MFAGVQVYGLFFRPIRAKEIDSMTVQLTRHPGRIDVEEDDRGVILRLFDREGDKHATIVLVKERFWVWWGESLTPPRDAKRYSYWRRVS